MLKKVLLVSVLLFTFASTATASSNTLYEVKKGDTLSKIAKANKVAVKDLQTWNKLTKDSIYVKQKLVVQKPKTAKAPTKVTTPVATAKPVTQPKTDKIVQPVQVMAETLITSPTPVAVEAKALSASGQAVYNTLVDFAKLLEGTPYLYAGNTIAGFDCSGFIHFVHMQAGLNMTRQSSESYFTQSATVSDPVVGDLVFFENTYKEGISHMGIYIGDDQFIHAGSKGVEITKLSNVYWKEHFVSFNRFHAVSVEK
ncbi:C40 family peptidase [Psychrobacillus soli]|uniref:LysM peptidoglycan-binding domain-containing protein n=1 Tax=Psychrobacillus soli TaxID=1543965 RepID=A0A544TJK0_9BACI|nr:C40 family peptidase [Psychrobacillus soli]TQR17640.1 LysM peptidoglycan-binding domain-containing protein [Psychrobacillus soli]